ncbi:hypothetical protein HDU96_004564 [Phlyctochytrium bullatum]|nr:hypothetical protein HDU96_004564 [Phlyctochytrium bullatum]
MEPAGASFTPEAKATLIDAVSQLLSVLGADSQARRDFPWAAVAKEVNRNHGTHYTAHDVSLEMRRESERVVAAATSVNPPPPQDPPCKRARSSSIESEPTTDDEDDDTCSEAPTEASTATTGRNYQRWSDAMTTDLLNYRYQCLLSPSQPPTLAAFIADLNARHGASVTDKKAMKKLERLKASYLTSDCGWMPADIRKLMATVFDHEAAVAVAQNDGPASRTRARSRSGARGECSPSVVRGRATNVGGTTGRHPERNESRGRTTVQSTQNSSVRRGRGRPRKRATSRSPTRETPGDSGKITHVPSGDVNPGLLATLSRQFQTIITNQSTSHTNQNVLYKQLVAIDQRFDRIEAESARQHRAFAARLDKLEAEMEGLKEDVVAVPTYREVKKLVRKPLRRLEERVDECVKRLKRK